MLLPDDERGVLDANAVGGTREDMLEELVADYDALVGTMDGYGMVKAAKIAELQDRMDELDVKVKSDGGDRL